MVAPIFIHFMPVDSPIFNTVFIQMVNEVMNGEEHRFIIGGKKESYTCLSKQYNNIVYEAYFQLATIKKYDTGCEILILHSMFLTLTELYSLKKKLLKRLVWCVWGHDLYQKRDKHSFAARFKGWIVDRKIGNIRAVVAGFKYDIYEIRRKFGERLPVNNALYASGYYKEDIDCIVQKHQRSDMSTNIMIGHSGFPFLQHEKLFRQLASYKDKDIVITLILSYGDENYAAKIVETASEIFGKEKLNVVRRFMKWDEYIQLLCDVDIAIFDFEHQAAFGNLILLSYLEKKLYLSSTGIMYRAFLSENVEAYSCSDIGNITFEELKARNSSQSDKRYVESLLDKENIINQWRQLFQIIR